MARQCTECGAAALTRTPAPNYRYTECGLSNVVVVSGIENEVCGECGAESLRIPALSRLHRAIALALSRKAGRFSGEEIRFLRKSVGLSGKDFAHVMGVTPETVSRWENDKDSFSGTPDRMLRLLVRTHDPERELDYSYAEAADETPGTQEVLLSRGRGGWRENPAAPAP